MSYPLGTYDDPDAPWNEPEYVECPDCEGEGCIECNYTGVMSTQDYISWQQY